MCLSVCDRCTAVRVCVFGYVCVESEHGWKQCKTLAKSYGTSVDTRKIQLPINLRQQPWTQVSRDDLSELFLLDLPFGSHNLCRSFVQLTFKLNTTESTNVVRRPFQSPYLFPSKNCIT